MYVATPNHHAWPTVAKGGRGAVEGKRDWGGGGGREIIENSFQLAQSGRSEWKRVMMLPSRLRSTGVSTMWLIRDMSSYWCYVT